MGLYHMARNVTDKDMGLKRILQELNAAKSAFVEVGIPEGAQADGMTIAEYGAYNEFGTSKIPERSFMRSTFDENVSRIQQDMQRQYDAVLAGRSTTYRALLTVGLKHSDQIKQKIRSGIAPANAPETIARKGSAKTLIDTGAMVQSITAVVKRG